MSYLNEDLNNISLFLQEHDFDNCHITVTGATGLIGSLIIKAIVCCNNEYNTNISVRAFARSKSKVDEIFGDCVNENIEFVYQDITTPISQNLKTDYIIHTANPTVSKYFITNPVETIEIIYTGSKNVLEYAKNVNAKSTVYLSSMEVFGATDAQKEKVFEKDIGYLDILNVRSCYSESKRLVECMCKCYAEEHNMNVKIARLAQVFGAGILKGENRVFAQFARSAINNEDIVLHTTGESVGNYCYTADAIKAIFLLLIKGESGQAYTVANENSTIAIKDMAAMVAQEIAKGRINVIFDIPEGNAFGYAPPTTMHLSSEKLRQLGWKPQVDLKEAYIRMMQEM